MRKRAHSQRASLVAGSTPARLSVYKSECLSCIPSLGGVPSNPRTDSLRPSTGHWFMGTYLRSVSSIGTQHNKGTGLSSSPSGFTLVSRHPQRPSQYMNSFWQEWNSLKELSSKSYRNTEDSSLSLKAQNNKTLLFLKK